MSRLERDTAIRTRSLVFSSKPSPDNDILAVLLHLFPDSGDWMTIEGDGEFIQARGRKYDFLVGRDVYFYAYFCPGENGKQGHWLPGKPEEHRNNGVPVEGKCRVCNRYYIRPVSR